MRWRIFLSVFTLGFSEFYFKYPLPDGARLFVALCSFGIAEAAYRKNVKVIAIPFGILLIIGLIGSLFGGLFGLFVGK